MSRTITQSAKSFAMKLPRLAVLMPKNPWADPQNSIGDSLGFLGRDHCWEAVGPAGELSKQQLFRDIKNLLELRHEYLTEGESVPCALLFEIYMTGRDIAAARPTILFCCERKPPRQRALKLIRSSLILVEHPAIRLGECSRPPTLTGPPRILFSPRRGDEHLKTSMEEFSLAGASNIDIYYYPPVDDVCGIPISVSLGEGINDDRIATMGGVICVGQQYLGLTVGHVFTSIEAESVTIVDTELEFSLEEYDSDEEVDDSEYGKFVVMTSRGSVTPQCIGFDDSRPSTIDEVDVVSVKTAMDSDGNPPNPILRGLPIASRRLLGRLSVVSTQTNSENLDWALIDISELFSSQRSPTLTRRFSRDICVSGIASPPKSKDRVSVVTAFNGTLEGDISENYSFVKLPNSDAFQEMWTIHLDGNVVKGDCGAWVLSASSGALYGHIVAGDPGASVAYVIPAYQIFEDIEKRFSMKAFIPLLDDVEEPVKSTQNLAKAEQRIFSSEHLHTNTLNPVYEDGSSKIKAEVLSFDGYLPLGEMTLSATDGYEKLLLKRISEDLKIEDMGQKQLMDQVHLPAEKNPDFVGRERELEEINQALSLQAICCLTGTTATGKTQIALEYAHRHANRYSHIFWVTNPTTMLLDLLSNASETASTGNRSTFKEAAKKRLLVLDNVEGGLEIKFLLYKLDINKESILITTKQREFATPAGMLWYRIEIYPLTLDVLAVQKRSLKRSREFEEYISPLDFNPLLAKTDLDLESHSDEHSAKKQVKLKHDSSTVMPTTTLHLSTAASKNPILLISNLVNSYIQECENPNRAAPAGFDDLDQLRISPLVDAAEEHESTRKRIDRKRTKVGCITCRRRRIKCGEEKPTCINCIKSKRSCDGYNQRIVFEGIDTNLHNSQSWSIALPIAPKPYSSALDPDVSIKPQANIELPLSTSTKEPFDTIFTHNLDAAELPPAGTFSLEYSCTNGDALISPSSPMSNGNYHPYDTLDNTSSCDASIMEDLAKDFEDEHLESNDLGIVVSLLARGNENSKALPSLQYFVTNFDDRSKYVPSLQSSPLRDSTVARILCHFVNAVGPSISMYERKLPNPSLIFHGGPVPMSQQHIWCYSISTIALWSPELLHAILAVSCLHIANLQNSSITSSLRHYAYSLRKVAKAVSLPVCRDKLATLAAALLLSWYEFIYADFEKWRSHLLGARMILKRIDFEGKTRYIKSKTLELRRLAKLPPTSPDDLDKDIVALLSGIKLYSNQDLEVSEAGSPGANTEKRYSERDIELYKTEMDLLWWFCKQDVLQSIISSDKLILSYEHWVRCAPRSPFSRLDAAYGTFDHLVLLLGRLLNFSAKDAERKREVLRRNGGSWQPPAPASHATPPSMPPFPGETESDPALPTGTAFCQHDLPSPAPSTFPQYLENLNSHAKAEWCEIRDAFDFFERIIGPDFRPLGPEFSGTITTTFGDALQYRTYAIAGIWIAYYMGLIILHRNHPSLPPAALIAAGIAASETASFGTSIGRIAAGIGPDIARTVDISSGVAAALIESSYGLFIAGLMYRDTLQRNWTAQRLHDISRLTGFKHATRFAEACESSWVKLSQTGSGPPYSKISEGKGS